MGLLGDVAGGMWGGAKSIGGGFKNFLSGGEGYNWEERKVREEQTGANRQREAESRAYQQAVADEYWKQLKGGPSVAENQLAATTEANKAQQIAMSRSGTGPMGAASANYEAARNAASINQAANRDAATLRAQEDAANRAALADLYDRMRAGDQGMFGSEADYELAIQNAYNQAQGAQAGAYEQGAQRNSGGGMAGAIGTAWGGLRGGK